MIDIDLLVESDALYMTTLPEGQSFTWRLLSLKEYKVFSTLRDQKILNLYDLYTQVFERCYVGDHRLINGNAPAGIFFAIGELILYLSGDSAGNEKDEIEIARSTYHASSVLEVVKRIVILAFGYKPDELENWSRQRLMKTFAQAEALLQMKGDYQPLDTSKIMTPEQAEKANRKKMNFEKDNVDINKEFSDRVHPLDMPIEELEKKAQKTEKLKAEQLRALDQSMKAEEAQQRKVHMR
jgi:hypothetical protein